MVSAGEFIINVSGNSTIVRPAERAQLNLKVSSSESSKEQASRNVLQTAQQIHAVLSDLSPKTETGEPAPGAPLPHFAMTSITTSSYQPRDNYNQPLDLVYTATTSFEAKFHDFAKMEELATKYTSVPLVDVTGVTWQLNPATRSSLASENRREAMRDAVVRAKDYAEAVGHSKLRTLEVNESHTRIDASGKASYMVRRRGGGAQASAVPTSGDVPVSNAAGSGEPLGVSMLVPEDIQLNHTISAKFQIL